MSGESVDSRITTMKFDNKDFANKVGPTLSMLDKLKKGLNFDAAKKGVEGLQKTTSRFSLGNMGSTVEGVSAKFVALSTVAITALANITNRAVNAGLSFAKSFTIGPVLDGLHEYETNLKSVQIIQANTDRPLKEIEKSLDQLNKYSDQTIYNFGEMAKNIGTFTAAGVDLKTSVSSIKGIANIAALSGSSSAQAATAMYQLSQAIASGKVGLQDWNSVVNAGMGGKKLQTALATTAEAMGVLEKGSVKLVGPLKQLKVQGDSFRQSITAQPGTEPWLTSDVLVNTLASLDGRFSKAAMSVELNANGTRKWTDAQIKARIAANRLALEQKNGVKFTDAQFKALRRLSDASFKSATEVKTLGQVFDIAKETIGSGWASSFRSIFGNLKEATALFTGMSNTINGFINRNALARNEMLAIWKKRGGRLDLIESFKNIFIAIGRIIKPISQAFRDIFPPMTGKRLAEITENFRKFTEGLILSKESSEDIRSVFRVVFKLAAIAFAIFGKAIQYFIIEPIRLLSGLLPGILSIAGGFADLIDKVLNFADLKDRITKVFDFFIKGRAKLLEPVIAKLNELLEVIGGFISSGASAAFDLLAAGAEKAAPYVEIARDAVVDFLDKIKEFVSGVNFGAVVDDVKNLAVEVKNALGGLDFGGAFSGIGGAISGAFSGAKDKAGGLGAMFDIGGKADEAVNNIDKVKNALPSLGELGQSISVVWDHLIDGLKAIGRKLKPVVGFFKKVFGYIKGEIKNFFGDMGMQDALAVINTGFFIALYAAFRSFLGKMGGLADSLGGTFKSMGKSFDALTGNLKAMQRNVYADIILKIALAVGVLAASMYVIAKIDSKKLGDSLRAIAILFTALGASLVVLGGKTAITTLGAVRLKIMADAMVAMGLSILALALAVAVFSRLDKDQLTRGILAIAALLGTLVATIALLNKAGGARAMLAASISIGILAVSLTMLAGTLKLYESMDWDKMKSGLIKVALALTAISVGMLLMPRKGMIQAAFAISILSVSLLLLGKALKNIGKMGVEELAKSLITLTIVLAELVVAMALMNGSIVGAAAMIIAAKALSILADAMIKLGSMDLWSIIKALIAVTGIFTVLGIAGVLLAPVIPVVAGLAIALGLLGAAALIAGTGMFLFATGFALLAASGAAGTAVLTAAIIAVAQTFPLIVQQIGLGMVALAKVIRTAGVDLIGAFGVILRKILDEVAKSAPSIAKAFVSLVRESLRAIRELFPDVVQTAIDLLITLAKGLSDNAIKITTAAVNLIVKFADTIIERKQLETVIDAAARLMLAFVRGIRQAIEKYGPQFRDEGEKIGRDIVKGIVSVLLSGTAADEISQALTGLVNIGKKAGGGIVNNIKDGIGGAISGLLPRAIGKSITKSIDEAESPIQEATRNMTQMVVDAANDALRNASGMIGSGGDFQPVITPVIDLTDIQKSASDISSLFASSYIMPTTSTIRASIVAEEMDETAASTGEGNVIVRDVTLQQNIHSPKAVSPVDTYREGKSLVALAKEELNK